LYPPAHDGAIFSVERAAQGRDPLEAPEEKPEPTRLDQARAVELVAERRLEIRGGAHSRGTGAAPLERAFDRLLDDERELAAIGGPRRLHDDRQESARLGLRGEHSHPLERDE